MIKRKCFPTSWKHSLLLLVPKSEGRSNPTNYHPISITCIISKVLKTIISDHFLKHLEKNSLISDHQYGFRRARSTGDLLSYVTPVWSSVLRGLGESFIIARIFKKHLTGYGIHHCFLNCLPLVFHHPFVPFSLTIFQTDPSL